MEDIEEDFKFLLFRLDFIAADRLKDLVFEMTSTAEKIDLFFKKPYESDDFDLQHETLRRKVSEVEAVLQKFHKKLDGNIFPLNLYIPHVHMLTYTIYLYMYNLIE